jgi:hypothetical protein
LVDLYLCIDAGSDAKFMQRTINWTNLWRQLTVRKLKNTIFIDRVLTMLETVWTDWTLLAD